MVSDLRSKRGSELAGEIKPGATIPTGWMNLQFRVKEWHKSAVEEEVPRYFESVRGTDNNFVSAIQVRLEEKRSTASRKLELPAWIFEGSGRLFSIEGQEVLVRYGRKRLTLPFPLHLNKFTVGNDPGTTKAATFESQVKVMDAQKATAQTTTISMNEPLVHSGYTFYQASYQLQEGRPPISIFAVNRDPGRIVKYAGSLIMVLGILLMFYLNPHYWDKIFGLTGSD